MDDEWRRELKVPEFVDLMKVDVDGSEETALRGLAGIAWRHLAMEVWRDRASGLTLDDALDLARDLWRGEPKLVWGAPFADGDARDVVLRRDG